MKILTAALHEWTATITLLASFVFSSFLFTVCSVHLWKSRAIQERKIKPLIIHVTAVAGVDAITALWGYASSVFYYQSFLVKGDPPWCQLFYTVRWWLILVSALWAATLALGVIAALLGHKRWVRRLRYSPIVVPLFALVLSLPNFAWPVALVRDCHTQNCEALPVCELSYVPCMMFGTQLTIILVFVLAVHAWAVLKCSRTLPGSVIQRSTRIVGRYLTAFWASYCLYAGSLLLYFVEEGHGGMWWEWYLFFSWRLLLLNGVFNFAALLLHVRSSAAMARQFAAPSVRLDIAADVAEVPQVNHADWERACEEEIARIQRTLLELGVDSDGASSYASSNVSTDSLPCSGGPGVKFWRALEAAGM